MKPPRNRKIERIGERRGGLLERRHRRIDAGQRQQHQRQQRRRFQRQRFGHPPHRHQRRDAAAGPRGVREAAVALRQQQEDRHGQNRSGKQADASRPTRALDHGPQCGCLFGIRSHDRPDSIPSGSGIPACLQELKGTAGKNARTRAEQSRQSSEVGAEQFAALQRAQPGVREPIYDAATTSTTGVKNLKLFVSNRCRRSGPRLT